MRIDLSFGNLESLQSTTAKRQTEGARDHRSPGRLDDATLSFGDSSVSGLAAAALSLPEVRSERIQELRNSINDGTYTIDPGAIANALLNDLR